MYNNVCQVTPKGFEILNKGMRLQYPKDLINISSHFFLYKTRAL